ncbi:MAG: PAS domain S-box protein [Woeseiaceae bacterium]|nr:PAS domain S-box protein [Woeseiaceae bacterium]
MEISALISIAAALALALVAYLIGRGQRKAAETLSLGRALAQAEHDTRVGIILENALVAIAHCRFDPPVSVKSPVDEIIKEAYASGYHADWNQAFARQYGYDADFDMSKVKLAEIVPLTDQRNYDFVRQFVENGFRVIREETFEIDRHGNAVEFLVSCAGRVHEDHLVEAWVTMIDITALNEARAALQFSEHKFSTAFHSSPDAILITRLIDGRIIDVNSGFESVFGYMSREAVGKTTTELGLWRDLSNREEWIRNLESRGASHAVEAEFQRKDGTVISCIASAGSIEIDGIPHVLSTVRDVTQEKRAERQRLALESELRQAQKMEAVGQLTSGIAHDFNNILASVVGYTELATRHPAARNSDALSEYLEGVLGASWRARDLVAQMLTFSRKQDSKALSTNVGRLIGSVVGLLRPTMPSSIALEVGAEANAGTIHIDPAQLEQVLINLCLNAKDAMRGNGTIHITASDEHVIDTACSACGDSIAGDMVAIEVADSGDGIPAEQLDRIFEPFFTTKGDGGGTGMGLAMVDRISHAHDGHIVVNSESGKGTSFCLYFPRDEEPVQLPVDTNGRAATAKPATSAGNILVVDDELTVATLLVQLLESRGYTAVAMGDSEQALQYFEHHRDNVDLVITDYTMPKLSGIELSEQLLRLDPELPVILLSGYTPVGDQRAARELGVRLYMNKPLEFDVFFKQLSGILEGNRGRSDGRK